MPSTPALPPSIRFNPSGGFGFASFHARFIAASGSLPTVNPVAAQKIYRAAYIQDDIHLTSKLTLNAGLRWELDGPFFGAL